VKKVTVLTESLTRAIFHIHDFRNVVTLKSKSEVTKGHRNRHRSIRHLWLPIIIIIIIISIRTKSTNTEKQL